MSLKRFYKFSGLITFSSLALIRHFESYTSFWLCNNLSHQLYSLLESVEALGFWHKRHFCVPKRELIKKVNVICQQVQQKFLRKSWTGTDLYLSSVALSDNTGSHLLFPLKTRMHSPVSRFSIRIFPSAQPLIIRRNRSWTHSTSLKHEKDKNLESGKLINILHASKLANVQRTRDLMEQSKLRDDLPGMSKKLQAFSVGFCDRPRSHESVISSTHNEMNVDVQAIYFRAMATQHLVHDRKWFFACLLRVQQIFSTNLFQFAKLQVPDFNESFLTGRNDYAVQYFHCSHWYVLGMLKSAQAFSRTNVPRWKRFHWVSYVTFYWVIKNLFVEN